jgi:hypothetical protein
MRSRVDMFAEIRRDARVEGLSVRELARGLRRQEVRTAFRPRRACPCRLRWSGCLTRGASRGSFVCPPRRPNRYRRVMENADPAFGQRVPARRFDQKLGANSACEIAARKRLCDDYMAQRQRPAPNEPHQSPSGGGRSRRPPPGYVFVNSIGRQTRGLF